LEPAKLQNASSFISIYASPLLQVPGWRFFPIFDNFHLFFHMVIRPVHFRTGRFWKSKKYSRKAKEAILSLSPSPLVWRWGAKAHKRPEDEHFNVKL
jgi:hypothetical protein